MSDPEEIARFFARTPGVLPLYECIEEKLMVLPGVEMKVQKSQIAFRANRAFAWVWLPLRKMKNRPDSYVLLSFGLDHRIDSPRIVQAVEPYPRRWTHHVIIASREDVDNELLGWLHQAHAFARRH